MQDSPLVVTFNPAIDKIMELPGFRIGQDRKGRLLSRTPSGKGINVARVAGQLQKPCRALCLVGRAEAALYERELRAWNIPCTMICTDGRTRENLTILDPENATQTHVREPGCTVDENTCAVFADAIMQQSRKAAWVVFSGSIPPGFPLPLYRELIQDLMRQGHQVAIDTSAECLQIAARLSPALLKPNRHELACIANAPLPSQDGIAAIPRSHGLAEVLVVTDGDRGAYAVSTGDCLHASVHLEQSDIVNATGSGDAFLAGMITALAEHSTLDHALRWGTACGAANARHARTGWVEAEEVHTLLQQVQVRRPPCSADA